MSAYQNIDDVSADHIASAHHDEAISRVGLMKNDASSAPQSSIGGNEEIKSPSSLIASGLKQQLKNVDAQTQGYGDIDDENSMGSKGFIPFNLYQFVCLLVAVATILFKVIFIPILNATTTEGYAKDRVGFIIISSFAIFLPIKLVLGAATLVSLILLFRDKENRTIRVVSIYLSIALYAIISLETLIDIETLGTVLHYWRYFGEKPAEQTATIMVVIGIAAIFLVSAFSFIIKFQKMLRVSVDSLSTTFQKITAVLKVNSFTIIMTLVALIAQVMFGIFVISTGQGCSEIQEFMEKVQPALGLYGLLVFTPVIAIIALALNGLVIFSVFKGLKDDWMLVRRIHKWLEILTLLLVAAVCGQAATLFSHTIVYQAQHPILNATCRAPVWSMEAAAITMVVVSVGIVVFEIIRSFAVGKEIVQEVQPETPTLKVIRNSTFPVLAIISAAACFFFHDAVVLPMLKSECALADKISYSESEQSLTLIGWILFAPAKLICIVAMVLLLRWLRRTEGNLVKLIKVIINWVGVATTAIAAIQGVISVCIIGEFIAIHLPEQQTIGQLRCFKGMLGALVWACIQVFVNLILSGIGAARICRLNALESKRVTTVIQYFKQQSFSIAVIIFAAVANTIDLILLPLHKGRCAETPGAPEDSVRLVIGLGLGLFLPLTIIASVIGIIMFLLPFWFGFDWIAFFSRKIKVVAVIVLTLVTIKVCALMGVLADCATFAATECGRMSIAALKIYAVEAVVIMTMTISEIARYMFFDEAPVEEYENVVSANTANTL